MSSTSKHPISASSSRLASRRISSICSFEASSNPDSANAIFALFSADFFRFSLIADSKSSKATSPFIFSSPRAFRTAIFAIFFPKPAKNNSFDTSVLLEEDEEAAAKPLPSSSSSSSSSFSLPPAFLLASFALFLNASGNSSYKQFKINQSMARCTRRFLCSLKPSAKSPSFARTEFVFSIAFFA